MRIIKLDFDFKDLSVWENFYRVFKAVFELMRIGRVKIKETYKGFHIYCELDRELTLEQIMNLRYYYGDDEWRIKYDEQRIKYAPHLFDVLYEEKEVIRITPRGITTIEYYKEREIPIDSLLAGDGFAYY